MKIERGYFTPKMLVRATIERFAGIEWDAVQLSSGTWAIRPKGAVGTHGNHPVIGLWEVFYTDAPTKAEALQIALHRRAHEARRQIP